jgi:RimJ/RimL family protein N-acetyltransferase
MAGQIPEFYLREVISVGDLSEKFLESLVENLSDSQHMRFSRHSSKKHNPQTSRVFIEELIFQGGRYFQILDISGLDFLGTLTLRPHSTLECEAGILIFKSAAGQGLGSAVWEGLPKMVKIAGYNRFLAGCHRDNLAMRTLMRNLGMSQISPKTLQPGNNSLEVNMYFALDLSDVPMDEI